MKIPSVKNYFDGEVSHGFVALYTGKTITEVASGILGIFMPIFMFNLFDESFEYTAFWYMVGYLFYGLTVFFGVRFLNNFGFRRALRASVFLGALYYALFYFVNDSNWKYFLPFVFLTLTLYRILYWVPYHVDFAKFTDKKNRGKQISILSASKEVIGVFVPLIGGFIISQFGFDVLFVTAILLFLVSYIPYMTLPHTQEKFIWSYGETIKQFFSKKHRKEMIAFMADGAETVVVLVVWPIFIFRLLNGNYMAVGLVSTLVIGVSLAMHLIVGKKMDKTPKKEGVLRLGSILSAIMWVAKTFIENIMGIFIAGSLHNLTKIFTRTPFDTISYEMAADQGHYVDEFTVIREIAINLGRVIMLSLAIFISIYFSIRYVFILAALATILLNFLKPNVSSSIIPRVGL